MTPFVQVHTPLRSGRQRRDRKADRQDGAGRGRGDLGGSAAGGVMADRGRSRDPRAEAQQTSREYLLQVHTGVRLLVPQVWFITDTL